MILSFDPHDPPLDPPLTHTHTRTHTHTHGYINSPWSNTYVHQKSWYLGDGCNGNDVNMAMAINL